MSPAFVSNPRRPAFAPTAPFTGAARTQTSFLSSQLRPSTSRVSRVHFSHCRSRCNICMKIGIIFSTVTGNTDEIAQLIKTKLGDAAAEPADVSDVKPDSLAAYEALIVGAPTWNTDADTERSGTSWDEFIYEDLPNIDLSGKPVAVFGLGDGIGYADNFCEAIEEVHDAFQKQGANMVGYTDTKGVDYEESKSVRDGVFIGLPLDNTNYSDDSEKKVNAWLSSVATEAGLQVAV